VEFVLLEITSTEFPQRGYTFLAKYKIIQHLLHQRTETESNLRNIKKQEDGQNPKSQQLYKVSLSLANPNIPQ
jgi:hypothetical protein